jgi:hypothetical protein
MVSYFTSTIVHLSLEKYLNLGLTPEETKQAIESVQKRRDYLDITRLESGFNYNWSFNTRYSNKDYIDDIVVEITIELEIMVMRKKGKVYLTIE